MDEQAEYRRIFALVMMHGLLSGRRGESLSPEAAHLASCTAVGFADALLSELAKVPAPSGGPVAPEKGNENASDSCA